MRFNFLKKNVQYFMYTPEIDSNIHKHLFVFKINAFEWVAVNSAHKNDNTCHWRTVG